MEMLTSPKTEYLLQASLEVLHEQSLEYLNEIAFIKEEIAFFNTLLNKNAGRQFPSEQSAAFGKELVSFNSGVVSVLQNKIMEHERWLSDIIKTDTLGRQESYRNIHREVTEEMNACHKRYFQLKKSIFSFVKSQE